MKTEIIYQYKPVEGFYISQVLAMNEKTIAVLNIKYRSPSLIHVIVDNLIVKQIDLADFKNFNSSSSENSFFIYKNGFGLIDYTNTILLWENIYSEPIIITISNPFVADSARRRHRTKFAEFNIKDECLYFGIEDISSSGFPARYWAKLEISHSLTGDVSAKWNCLNELPIESYTETSHRQRLETQKSWGFYLSAKEKDWLNINAIMIKDERIYIPTDGGFLSRAKSGIRYEYSLISILDMENNLIRNHEIIEGTGNFTFNKNQYLLHSKEKRNKVFIYDTSDFKIESEVTISSKQNLGVEKNIHLAMNIVGETFYLYNTFFLNTCNIK